MASLADRRRAARGRAPRDAPGRRRGGSRRARSWRRDRMLMLPGAAALAALGAIRLVPIGIVLAPAFVLTGGLVGLALVTELRIARASGPASSPDRTAVLIEVLVIGFLGFAGVAALVPGGLPAPGIDGAIGRTCPGGHRPGRRRCGDRIPARVSRGRAPVLQPARRRRGSAPRAPRWSPSRRLPSVRLRSRASSGRRCSCSCSSCGMRSTAAARRGGETVAGGKRRRSRSLRSW